MLKIKDTVKEIEAACLSASRGQLKAYKPGTFFELQIKMAASVEAVSDCVGKQNILHIAYTIYIYIYIYIYILFYFYFVDFQKINLLLFLIFKFLFFVKFVIFFINFL